MKKHRLIFLVMGLMSCSTITISQQPHEDNIYIIQQLDKADIYYPQEKIIEIANKKLMPIDSLEKSALERLKKNRVNIFVSPINKNTSRQDVEMNLLISQIAQEIIQSGEVSVFNKETGKFVSKIKCKVNKSQGIINSISFVFQNGDSFYNELISIIEVDR